MDKTLDQLVGYAADLSYADLTPEAIHAVKRSLIDSIGCALGAFHAPPLRAVRTLVSRVSSTSPATVIGTRIRSSPELAGFINSGMIRYLDFSDDYFGNHGDSGPHPSDNIGGVLAAVESSGRDGSTLILGIALAYEVCDRIVDETGLRERGWDYSVLHSIATALAAGKILGLSRQQMRHAVALAVIPNISLSQTKHGEISHWKSFGGPNGSRNGYFAAQLAMEDITGPAQPFEGKGGLMQQLDNTFELAAFGGHNVPFRIERTFFKYLPVRYTIQLPVWVALEARDKASLADIESICVYLVGRYAIARGENPAEWDPQTRETAGHSVPYLVAAALIDGAITSSTLTPQRYRDPAILEFAQKVELKEDKEYTAAFPKTFHCRLEVKLKSGTVVVVHKTNPKGHPDNPMSDQEIEAKFLNQAEGAVPKQQAQQLLAQLWKLDSLDDMSRLFDLMLVQPG